MIIFGDVKLYTAAEIAVTLGKNEQGVRRLLRLGKLNGRMLGNRWYCTDADVNAYLTGDTQADDHDNRNQDASVKTDASHNKEV